MRIWAMLYWWHMDEKIDRIEKNVNDLIEIVVAIKDNMVTKHEFEEFKQEMTEFKSNTEARFDAIDAKFEKMDAKIDRVQRAVDAGFERQSMLEARVTKVEIELGV